MNCLTKIEQTLQLARILALSASTGCAGTTTPGDAAPGQTEPDPQGQAEPDFQGQPEPDPGLCNGFPDAGDIPAKTGPAR